MEIKNCIFCTHLYVSPEEDGYSEYTPGWDFRMDCLKYHWKFEDFNDIGHDSLVSCMVTAETCEDYELDDFAIYLMEKNNANT